YCYNKGFYIEGFNLPPHQRHSESETEDDSKEKRVSGKAQNIFSRINSDIRALNSSILVMSQKIKYVVRNEKILGRNLLVLNKKIKTLQGGQSPSNDFSTIEPELAEINRKLNENAEAIGRLESEISNIKENYSKAEDVAEIKYVIDTINPLEFVSIKDVKDLMQGKKVAVKEKKK
ncbi:MAG: hypothetical protein NUV57_00300, partial [archaeon]|nr:hypothetical protein [archaeon]